MKRKLTVAAGLAMLLLSGTAFAQTGSVDIWNLPEFQPEEGPYTSSWDTLRRSATFPAPWLWTRY